MRNYIRKTNRRSWSRQAMFSAITECLNGSIGLQKASKLFRVPRSTLRDRIQQTKCGKTIAEAVGKRYGRKTIFTVEQEKELMSYILEMEPKQYELTLLSIRKIAYRFAQQKRVKHNFNISTETAGLDWFLGFKARHPDVAFYITTKKMPKWSKDSVALLINLYKENSSLHDMDSKLYYDKPGTKKTLENIAEQLQEIRPGTTDTEVRRKLECLRSAYLSVRSNIETLLNEGISASEMHTQSLWYYKQLSFLGNYIEPSLTTSCQYNTTPEETYIKLEEAEINIETLDSIVMEESSDTEGTLMFTELDTPYFIQINPPSTSTLGSNSGPRPVNRRQYLAPKTKRAMENDPLEIPPADGLKSSDVMTSKQTDTSQSIDEFISYISARMQRITNKDILQELEDEILLKVMQAEKDDRKRQHVASC